MKHIIISLFVLSTVFVSAAPAYAGLAQNLRETVRETIEEGREAELSPAAIRKNVREEVRVQITEKNESLIDRVKNFVKKRVRFNARITGEITSVGANALTVTAEDGKTYTLNINSATKLVRRFGGQSTLAEFKVGNKVNVFGEFTNDEETTVNVKLVRNVSIQKRWGVFFGTVKSKGDTSFTLDSSNRGTQTVYVEGAQFKNRREEGMTYADVQIEQRVRVKGMWDRSSNEITDVDEVKNFSVPAQPVED
jgi:hypothetical protein